MNELHSASSVIGQLAAWFEAYNEVHPPQVLAPAITQGVQKGYHNRLGGPV